MDENPITEEWELIEALMEQVKCAYYSCASGDGLTDRLSLLRQKLSQKAKQEQCAFNSCANPDGARPSGADGNPIDIGTDL